MSIGPAVLRELYARLATERSGVPREFGGVLLGTVESTEPLRTRVDRFEPFPLKAQDGTTYTLSSADQQRLGRFSERLSGRAAAVVGFFRSHERRGLYLDQRDFELFRLYFQHPGSVFLLLRAETDRLARGGIFVWEDGDMRRDSSYEEFLIAPPPETAVARRPAAAYDARERLRPAATALLAVAVPLLSFYGARTMALGRRPHIVSAEAAPVEQPFELISRQSGTNVEFRWNPQSVEVRRAQHSHLTITDGPFRQQFWLSKAELAAGSYLYSPASSTVVARMDLYSYIDGRDVRADVALPAADENPGRQGSTPLTESGATPLARNASHPSVASLPKPIASAATSLRMQPTRHERPFYPGIETIRSHAPAQEPLPEPPPLPALAPPKLPEPIAVLRPSLPWRAQVSTRVDPVAPPAMRQILQKIPGLRKIQGGRYNGGDGFVPARGVEQPLPALPPEFPFDNTTTVESLIRIDRSGRVTDVNIIGGDNQLANAALDALWHWRFEPAVFRGAPVESQARVVFAFRNGRD